MPAGMVAAVLVIFFALLGIATVVLWEVTRPAPRTVTTVGPRRGGCGRCGYDARGLPTPICPECGADLRVVGTLYPTVRARPWWAFPLGWTILVAVATLIAAPPAAGRFGVARRQATYTLTGRYAAAPLPASTAAAAPAAALNLGFDARAEDHYWLALPAPPLRYESATLGLQPRSAAHLQLDSRLQSAVLVDGAGEPLGPAGPFDAAAVVALSASQNGAADDDVAEVAVRKLLAAEDSRLGGRVESRRPGSSGSASGGGGGGAFAKSGRRVVYRYDDSATYAVTYHPLTLALLLPPLLLWGLGLALDRRRRGPMARPK